MRVSKEKKAMAPESDSSIGRQQHSGNSNIVATAIKRQQHQATTASSDDSISEVGV
jgi:hypothetical protein